MQEQSGVIFTVDERVANGGAGETGLHYQGAGLLAQKDIYRFITIDPTYKHKNKLKLLRTIKTQAGLGDNIYERLSNRCRPPKFYGVPKIYKQGTPSDL